jgi:hypothetical protein
MNVLPGSDTAQTVFERSEFQMIRYAERGGEFCVLPHRPPH